MNLRSCCPRPLPQHLPGHLSAPLPVFDLIPTLLLPTTHVRLRTTQLLLKLPVQTHEQCLQLLVANGQDILPLLLPERPFETVNHRLGQVSHEGARTGIDIYFALHAGLDVFQPVASPAL